MSLSTLPKPSTKVKPRVVVDADGIIHHRTKLLTLTVATNFARCQRALAGNEEQKRADRAANAEFQFFADPDNSSLVFCLSDTGSVYELRRREGTFVNCSCPDSTVGIARRLLIPCKHRIAAAEEFPAQVHRMETAEEKRARILRERDEDYGD